MISAAWNWHGHNWMLSERLFPNARKSTWVDSQLEEPIWGVLVVLIWKSGATFAISLHGHPALSTRKLMLSCIMKKKNKDHTSGHSKSSWFISFLRNAGKHLLWWPQGSATTIELSCHLLLLDSWKWCCAKQLFKEWHREELSFNTGNCVQSQLSLLLYQQEVKLLNCLSWIP